MTEAVKPTIVLLQTQAESGGAQEIARILGNAWSAMGTDVHYCFFFRRTGSFDDTPNVYFAYPERPRGVAQIAKMAAALLRHLRIINPDAVLTFQHYGNIIGAPIARAAGVKNIIANLNTSRTMLPTWVLATDWILAASGIYSRSHRQLGQNGSRLRKAATTVRAAFVPHRSRFRAQDQRQVEA